MTPGISCPSSCEIMVHLGVYCALLYCGSILVLIIALYLRPTLMTPWHSQTLSHLTIKTAPSSHGSSNWGLYSRWGTWYSVNTNSGSNSPILQVPTSPFHRPSRQATEKVRVPKAKAVERTLIQKSVDMSSVRIWIQQNRYSQIMRHCKQNRTIETEPRRTVDLPQN